MLKKILFICINIMLIIFLCSCDFSQKGESLYSFCEKVNAYNESYALTPDGYIYSESDNSFTRYFKFSDEEVMLKFFADEKNRLTELNIVFDTDIEKNGDISEFTQICTRAFCGDEKIYKTLKKNIDWDTVLATPSYETKCAENGNIELKIDVTEIGTVISIFKDI